MFKGQKDIHYGKKHWLGLRYVQQHQQQNANSSLKKKSLAKFFETPFIGCQLLSFWYSIEVCILNLKQNGGFLSKLWREDLFMWNLMQKGQTWIKFEGKSK